MIGQATTPWALGSFLSGSQIMPQNSIAQLSSLEDTLFQQWVAKNKIQDLDHPDSHYDYRGFWKTHPDFSHAPGEHFPDTFKQPGHPTFSNESQYATPQNFGGRWADNDQYIPQLSTSRQSVDPTQVGNSVKELLRQLLEGPK